jgi:hypothetical protein
MDGDSVQGGLEQALKRLKARRDASRPRPALDDKVLFDLSGEGRIRESSINDKTLEF